MKDGQLRYIDEHAFDGLENLRHLNMENNLIASVYLELFQSILNLHVSWCFEDFCNLCTLRNLVIFTF